MANNIGLRAKSEGTRLAVVSAIEQLATNGVPHRTQRTGLRTFAAR